VKKETLLLILPDSNLQLNHLFYFITQLCIYMAPPVEEKMQNLCMYDLAAKIVIKHSKLAQQNLTKQTKTYFYNYLQIRSYETKNNAEFSFSGPKISKHKKSQKQSLLSCVNYSAQSFYQDTIPLLPVELENTLNFLRNFNKLFVS